MVTNLGKQAIGMPIIDKNLALNILKPVSLEKAFHFYYDLDQYSGIYSNSLEDFADKLKTIDLNSIEFHAPRKDFEFWIRALGDIELAKKVELIRMKNFTGNDLRNEIHQTISSRLGELLKKSQ